MKIYAKELLEGLKKVKRTKLHALRILNHVLLTVENHKTTLTTTDLENPLRASCESFTDDNFSVCVPMVLEARVQHDNEGYYSFRPHTFKYYPFYDLVKVYAEDNALLEIAYLHCTCEIQIKHDRSTNTIKCIDSMEFPAVTL